LSEFLEIAQAQEDFGLAFTLSELGIEPEGLNLSEFDTSEPLGILVELAKNGRIDPWDIDIVKLTDSFLGRIEELKQLDLRVSSRTLLYSAILLRMKSNGILREEEAEEEPEPDFFEDIDFPEPEAFPTPKLPLRRKATRPVTLGELITELKKAEKALSRKKEKQRKSEAEKREKPTPFMGDVRGIAHEEAIVERVGFVWEKLAGIFETEQVAAVPFSHLLKESSDRILDYIALLFLASEKKVWLFQEKLFEELYIYPGKKSGFSPKKKVEASEKPKLKKQKPELERKKKKGNRLALASKPEGFAAPKLSEKSASFEAKPFEE